MKETNNKRIKGTIAQFKIISNLSRKNIDNFEEKMICQV